MEMDYALSSPVFGDAPAFSQVFDHVDQSDVARIRSHACALAARHRLAAKPRRDQLRGRLQEARLAFSEAYRSLSRSASARCPLPLAARWLLDNHGWLQEQCRMAARILPPKPHRCFPQLAGAARPRVYEVAQAMAYHLDGDRSRDNVHQFLSAYQSVSPLKLAELWAVPGMLHLVLLESLAGSARRVGRQRLDRPLQPSPGDDGGGEQVNGQGAIGRGITSLRTLGNWDWREFVEEQSLVERILREDPAGIYTKMDFQSRDRYRQIVAHLAARSPMSEEQVARTAIAHARSACGPAVPQGQSEGRQRHVGYFLADRGRQWLEKSVAYRPTWKEIVARRASRAGSSWYLLAIAIAWMLTVAGAAAGCWLAWPAVGSFACLIVLPLFAAAAGQCAVHLVNWLCAQAASPHPTFRLDFSGGIPSEARTLVAVPAMLTSEATVRELVEQLELRFVANRDENLWFALLTDFADAAHETMPNDQSLLALASREIERLNQRYCRGRPPTFYLLHRPRRWNGQQGAWMAQERKRGKLAALNRLIRGGSADAFTHVVGDVERLTSVRYVITLDADTRLPRDTGRELAACMAHPLNRPRIDPRSGCVVEGYAVLQPRVGTTIPDAYRSRFTRLSAGDAGIDPYTRQTSDVYQDLFAEGSFIGKGIYDVEAFSKSLDGRFPDNRVLSHDLIEGCFARSGLVNDIELFEGLPCGVLADLSRRHRWIRGDWQIAAWLGRRIPTASGWQINSLSGLSRWKIFDNLRRSLSPLFLWSFLVLGWATAPALAAYWTFLALAITFGPLLIESLPGVLQKFGETPWRVHLAGQGRRFLQGCTAEAVSLCFLPHTVRVHLDAILRTLYRLHVSHRNLLEWTTAVESESHCRRCTCWDHYKIMWACPVTGVTLATILALVAPGALWFAGPFVAAWFVGPFVAWRISQPYPRDAVRVSRDQRRLLRRWARQTWHYFESFVGASDHWLPPDHVLAEAGNTVASRTSPTNIGLGLLASLGAYDLGYLPAAALLERTDRALHTMLRLERYRGHLYNWYDTRTLQPVEPRYVSSVDSGNLWGALVVLATGLEELRDRPLLSPHLAQGFHDTLDAIAALRTSSRQPASDNSFDLRLAGLREECSLAFQGGMRLACRRLRRIHARATDLAACVEPDQGVLRQWTQALVRQSALAHEDLSRWVFWTDFRPDDASFAEVSRSGREMLALLRAWFDRLDARCTLNELLQVAEQTDRVIHQLLQTTSAYGGTNGTRLAVVHHAATALRKAAGEAAAAARSQLHEISTLTSLCRRFGELDFQFLFDGQRKLLAVGFRVDDRRLDSSQYDLLASEARLASFLAVSHGQLPLEHWFSLGRPVTLVDGRPALLSWSGSMFEYLMPLLFTPCYPGTLLDVSCRAAVRWQVRYGRRQGVPWGISESSCLSSEGGYGYRSFGVPGLGMMRGLGAQLVIAPYAAALALMIAPGEACANLSRLEEMGAFCPYGYYDAIEYRSRGGSSAVEPQPCKLVMTHHAGMTFLAIVNTLADNPMRRRFLKEPVCAAHELLLHERVPQNVAPVGPELLDTAPWNPSADQELR